jgi:hypothetical protein
LGPRSCHEQATLPGLKDFRSQILALGVFWIVIGAIAGGLGLYLATQMGGPEMPVGGAIVAGFGLVWVVLGALVDQTTGLASADCAAAGNGRASLIMAQ